MMNVQTPIGIIKDIDSYIEWNHCVDDRTKYN